VLLLRRFTELTRTGYLWSKGYAALTSENGGTWFVVSSTQKLQSRRYYQKLGCRPSKSYWIKLGSQALSYREDNLSRFVKYTLPQIRWSFDIIISDGDSSLGDLLRVSGADTLLRSPYLKTCYVQNCVWGDSQDSRKVCEQALRQRRLFALPIGLDFHTDRGYGVGVDVCRAFAQLCQSSPERRRPKILVDFCSEPNCSIRRIACQKLQQIEEVHVLDRRLPQRELWALYRQYAGILSLPGHGVDCHRTWEALYLGAVPIVQKYGAAMLFKGLPVVELADLDLDTVEWGKVLDEVLCLQNSRQKKIVVPEHIAFLFGCSNDK
jgi:hypothetical protein